MIGTIHQFRIPCLARRVDERHIVDVRRSSRLLASGVPRAVLRHQVIAGIEDSALLWIYVSPHSFECDAEEVLAKVSKCCPCPPVRT